MNLEWTWLMESGWAVWFSLMVKGTLLLAAAALLTRLMVRRSAAARHLVWVLAFGGLWLLPVLELLVPVWTIPAPWLSLLEVEDVDLESRPLVSRDTLQDGVARSDVELPTITRLGTGNPGGVGLAMASDNHAVSISVDDLDSAPEPAAAPDVRSAGLAGFLGSALTPGRLLSAAAAVWTTGVLWGWSLLAWGLGTLMVRRWRSRPAPEGLISSIARVSLDELQLSPRVDIRLSADDAIPATWGWRHPTVLLPEAARFWPAGRIHCVLQHELAHVGRRDWVTQMVALGATAMHWVNPLAWWSLKQLRLEQELACDDRVLATGTSAVDYAAELVAVLRDLGPHSRAVRESLAISRPSDIELRLRALLDPTRPRAAQPRLVRLAVSCAALLLIALLGTVRLDSSTTAVAQTAAVLPEGVTAAENPASQHPDEVLIAQAAGAGERCDQADPMAGSDSLQLGALGEVRKLIRENFTGRVDDEALERGAVEGMLAALGDPYTKLLAPVEAAPLLGGPSAGCVSGIGAMFKNELGRMLVVAPLPGSPAWKGGLKPGDVVVRIDGQASDALGFEAAIRSIAGPAGSEIELDLLRAGEPVRLRIVRGQVVNPSVRGVSYDGDRGWNHWLDREQKIGYVRLGAFDSLTAADLKAALTSLAGLRGLILDLRNSPGGLHPTAVEVAQMFIPEGTLWTLRGAGPEKSLAFHANANHVVSGDVPLMVLVDDSTASAAEILAGALQESGRGVIVGHRTYGKGSVQTVVPVNGSRQLLRLTTALVEIGEGRTIDRSLNPDRWGVDPQDGFWVLQSVAERQARDLKRHELDTDGAAAERLLAERADPEQVALLFADRMLSAAVRGMQQRLVSGRFVPVGESAEAALVALQKRTALERERAELQRKLLQIDQELSGLSAGGV